MESIILPWYILPFKTQNKPVNFKSLDVLFFNPKCCRAYV